MTGLTEFLPPRIAEDEAPTWELIPYRCEPGCCAPAGWVGHRCLICGTEEFGGTAEAITRIAREHDESIHRRSRVLAECEAKRRIVESHWDGTPDPDFPELLLADCPDCRQIQPCRTLRMLALPYADHPDYQPEWRP